MNGTRRDTLEEIKLKALYIERQFMSEDAEAQMRAEYELAELKNRFCREFDEFVTPPMARAAQKDFSTFLVLIEWALDYYRSPDH